MKYSSSIQREGPVSTTQLHSDCIMCGNENPFGFKLSYRCTGEGSVEATVNISPRFQGYHGLVHGGVIACLLDSAMAQCLLKDSIPAVTGDLNIRYRLPVPIQQDLLLRGEKIEQRNSLYMMKAVLSMENKLLATATARFMYAPETIYANRY